MTATLVKSPLRMSPPMITDWDGVEVAPDTDSLPLAYHYATWTAPEPPKEPLELGHYNPETQTWDAPPGVITAGHWTWSYKGSPWSVPQTVDDSCS